MKLQRANQIFIRARKGKYLLTLCPSILYLQFYVQKLIEGERELPVSNPLCCSGHAQQHCAWFILQIAFWTSVTSGLWVFYRNVNKSYWALLPQEQWVRHGQHPSWEQIWEAMGKLRWKAKEEREQCSHNSSSHCRCKCGKRVEVLVTTADGRLSHEVEAAGLQLWINSKISWFYCWRKQKRQFIL